MNQPHDPKLGTLPTYATSDRIIPFSLAREAFDYDIIKQWQDQWLYYASKSPLWYSRLFQYSFSICHKERKVTIHSDDDIEEFHTQYRYDPEQASTDTIDCIIPRIYQEHKLMDWMNYTFPNEKIRENCGDYARFATYLKYRISELMEDHHVWY